MEKLPNKATGESKLITFDFFKELAAGATLTGTPTVTKATIEGTDPGATALTLGSPSIVANRYVQVMASAGADGAAYKLTATADATNGERHVIEARLGIGPIDFPA